MAVLTADRDKLAVAVTAMSNRNLARYDTNANQALSAEYMLKNGSQLEKKVYSVPEVIDEGVTGFVVESIEQAVKAVERVASLSRRKCRQVFETRFSARRMASDYLAIITTAVAALRMPPATRAVLVGKSRGAGLAVGAAIDSQLNATLAGVLAIGLTREEEYVHGSRSQELVMLQTYARVEDLGQLPVAVIQSSNDEYVPAAEARQLLGPDTAWRVLVPIESRDHNFDGATDVLYREMKRSLQWILHR